MLWGCAFTRTMQHLCTVQKTAQSVRPRDAGTRGSNVNTHLAIRGGASAQASWPRSSVRLTPVWKKRQQQHTLVQLHRMASCGARSGNHPLCVLPLSKRAIQIGAGMLSFINAIHWICSSLDTTHLVGRIQRLQSPRQTKSDSTKSARLKFGTRAQMIMCWRGWGSFATDLCLTLSWEI